MHTVQDKNCNLYGKTVVLTGATGGIGSELCRRVLKLGANLVTVTRDALKTENLFCRLKCEFPFSNITTLSADLENIDDVKNVAEELKQMPVDILILNAGAYSIPRRKTAIGFDNVFQVNFVSQYYILREMLPNLNARGGSVVAVGSIAYRYSKTDKKDIDFSGRNSSALVYGNSKRYLMFSLFELFKSQTGASLSVAHPGITFTNITAHYPKLLFALIKYPMKFIFMKPSKACESIVKAIFEKTEYHTWIGPSVLDVWGSPKVKKLCGVSQCEAESIFENAEAIYNNIKNR